MSAVLHTLATGVPNQAYFPKNVIIALMFLDRVFRSSAIGAQISSAMDEPTNQLN